MLFWYETLMMEAVNYITECDVTIQYNMQWCERVFTNLLTQFKTNIDMLAENFKLGQMSKYYKISLSLSVTGLKIGSFDFHQLVLSYFANVQEFKQHLARYYTFHVKLVDGLDLYLNCMIIFSGYNFTVSFFISPEIFDFNVLTQLSKKHSFYYINNFISSIEPRSVAVYTIDVVFESGKCLVYY